MGFQFSRFRKIFRNSQTSTNERGVAFVEFALSCPLLLTLFAFTFDTGMAVERYLTMTRIAYESARQAANMTGLESGCFINGTQRTRPTAAINQQKLYGRISTLIRDTDLSPGEFRVEAKHNYAFNPADAPCVDSNVATNMVQVSLSSSYRSVFPIVNNFQIRVSSSAPHLRQ